MLGKIFELATNEPLFPLETFGLTAEQIDQEHLYLVDQMLDKNGQMDKCFIEYLTDRLPSDFGAGNIQHLASYLVLMLQRDPQRRLTTTKLLNQPFLTESED